MNHASVQLEQLTPLHPCGTPKYPNQPWILLRYITIIVLTIIIIPNTINYIKQITMIITHIT